MLHNEYNDIIAVTKGSKQ